MDKLQSEVGVGVYDANSGMLISNKASSYE